MRVFVLLFALLLGFGSPIFAADAKDFLKVPIQKTRAENKWAIVVGADNYLNVSPLQICGKDARAFRQFLIEKMGFPSESIIFLADDAPDPRLRPNYTALKRQINLFLEGVDENSEVVLFFSGHGVRFNDRDWLVPLDGDPDSVSETCIDYNALRDKLETKRPRRALLITDACRNLLEGKGITRGSGFGESAVANLPQFGELRSCQPREVSQWLQDRSMSVFTHYLLSGLSGAAADESGRVTFDGLRSFVTGKTRQYVAANWQKQQNPDGRASFGEMVLAQIPNQTPFVPEVPKPVEKPIEKPVEKPVEPPVNQTPKINLPPLSSLLPLSKINPRDGAEMVYVPAGTFTRGMSALQVVGAIAGAKAAGENAETFWFESQTPAQSVLMDGFWIYKTEVTNAQYRRFCEETSRAVPQTARDRQWDNYPITFMTWDDARAYAQWAGGDLPTESQWEKAARGPKNFDYPWGNEWDANKSVNKKPGPYPVAYLQTDKSGVGAFDMAGNVSEWCRDTFDPDFYKAEARPNSWNSTEGFWKAGRGGSFEDKNVATFHRATNRLRLLASWQSNSVGFRVVVEK